MNQKAQQLAAKSVLCASLFFFSLVSSAQQLIKFNTPQLKIINHTATLILTFPDNSVRKIGPDDLVPAVPWGTKISAVFGQAVVLADNYELNLQDGSVVQPLFNERKRRTTIIVPAESVSPVTVRVGKETAVLDKGDIIHITANQTGESANIIVARGEVNITGAQGQFTFRPGDKTTVGLKEASQTEQLASTPDKKTEIEPQKVELKDELSGIPPEPLVQREEASPSSP